eukprot:comp23218_c0_seq1/m.37816 comp23218_c0_seq1/g.37816  ORF comp23218_c0_seq1/g.37816 comp23218_c0_seq1/m.37816 type:complete len:111 (+) comp23218_c0_seq1:503-835(+)
MGRCVLLVVRCRLELDPSRLMSSPRDVARRLDRCDSGVDTSTADIVVRLFDESDVIDRLGDLSPTDRGRDPSGVVTNRFTRRALLDTQPLHNRTSFLVSGSVWMDEHSQQ